MLLFEGEPTTEKSWGFGGIAHNLCLQKPVRDGIQSLFVS